MAQEPRTPEEIADLLAAAVDLADTRAETSLGDDTGHPPHNVVILIDELATIAAQPTNEVRDRICQDLRTLLFQGRSAAVGVHVVLDAPDQVCVELRQGFPTISLPSAVDVDQDDETADATSGPQASHYEQSGPLYLDPGDPDEPWSALPGPGTTEVGRPGQVWVVVDGYAMSCDVPLVDDERLVEILNGNRR